MFDKFGEFDSFNEINELAENLLNEGDIESLKVVAKENGIQADFVDLYTNGEIPELEIIAYEKEDIDKLVSFMING